MFYAYKLNGHYFDDYQIEELSDWSTKHLQNRIDSNIYYVTVTTQMILSKQINGQKPFICKWNQDEISEFLHNQSEIPIYYYCDKNISTTEEYTKYQSNKKII